MAAHGGEIEPVRSEAERLAGEALDDYLSDHPTLPMRAMFDHFFPPTEHPFTREDLRLALVERIYYGRIIWDSERRLSLAESAEIGRGPDA